MAYVKGAPKEVLCALHRASRWTGRNAHSDEALRAQIVAANDDYARNGLRVLAVARRPVTCSLSECYPRDSSRAT